MSSGPPAFEAVWEKVCEHAGEFFRTGAGQWFTYRIDGGFVVPSHSDAKIPRSDFELAFPLLPLPSPAKIAKFVTGARWIHAILHDARISEGRW